MANQDAQAINQALTTIPVTRYAEELYTTSYLDNPIQFTVDVRFNPSTVLGFLNVIPNALQRDISNYTVVNNNNATPQYKMIPTYSFVLDRNSYYKALGNRLTFTQFGV